MVIHENDEEEEGSEDRLKIDEKTLKKVGMKRSKTVKTAHEVEIEQKLKSLYITECTFCLDPITD